MIKLLIIEDQPELLETLKVALAGEYAVSGALTAEAGLTCALEIQPQVVLVDYVLPAMNGLELAANLRRLEQSSNGGRGRVRPRIIMFSAQMDEQLAAKALQAGVDQCLAKPFDLNSLKAAIKADNV